MLSQRVRAEPGRQTSLVHFQIESALLLSFRHLHHSDTFEIFAVYFGCVEDVCAKIDSFTVSKNLK